MMWPGQWENGGYMTGVNADNLPWYLIGILVTALSAVFYAMLRGKIMASGVAELIRQSAEKRAEIAEAGVVANTKSVESLKDSVDQLTVFAENQDKILKALHEHANRDRTQRRGGPS